MSQNTAGIEVVNEYDIPKELQDAREAGKQLQGRTIIGWIDIDNGDHLHAGVVYRIKPEPFDQ